MNNSCLNQTLQAIDQANLADPNQDTLNGELQPKEYVYSQHMTNWLFKLEENPSDLMQIACRAQHLERWKMPRASYPEGRKGYYAWRIACGQMHGRRAAEIMSQCGYAQEDCLKVESVITKKELRTDADTQLLEDVACMVFLERYFSDFYDEKHDYDKEKWLRIVGRTWNKMTERGQNAALELAHQLPEHLQDLMKEAIES